MLRRGSKGSEVEFLQERLNAHGFHLKVDGDFGKKTYERVRQFQASRNLKVDGIVGDKTWDALQVVEVVTPPTEVWESKNKELITKAMGQMHLVPNKHRGVVTDVLKAALADLGAVETPNGSNKGEQIDHLVGGYNQYWWILKDGALDAARHRGYVLESEARGALAWCGMAVSQWIRIGMGLPNWNFRSGFVKAQAGYKKGKYMPPRLEGHPWEYLHGGPWPVEEWAKQVNAWCPAKVNHKVAPGTVFTMNRDGSGSDPTAATEKGHIGMVVYDDGSHVVTIEGNVSNGVFSRRRKKSSLRRFITWWSVL